MQQVIASAADMQVCLDEGLPRDALVTLVLARRSLRGDGPWPDRGEMVAAINHPGARRFDQVSVAAIRKALRE